MTYLHPPQPLGNPPRKAETMTHLYTKERKSLSCRTCPKPEAALALTLKPTLLMGRSILGETTKKRAKGSDPMLFRRPRVLSNFYL